MRTLLALLVGALTVIGTFSGTYKGTQDGVEFTLDLKQDGSKVSGTAKGTAVGTPVTFILNGAVTGDTSEGDIKLEGDDEKMKFRATLTSEGLELKIADLEDGKANWAEADNITFKRTSTEPPAEKPAGEGKLVRHVKAPTDMLKNGKEYTHASGGKFRYPASWALKEEDVALVLTPADAGPDEHIVITGEKAQGATDPSAPEILAYLDQSVKALFPDMKRVGGVEKATAGAGKGAFLVWEGDIQGKPSQVRAYVTILKGYGVSVIGVGPKEAIAKRDQTLRDIFYTFGWGQGKVDQRLVGTWKHWAYAQASGRESTANAVLNADGTFTYTSSSEMAANHKGTNQYGDQTAWGAMYSRSGSGWKGTWTADGSEIRLNFEDGSTEAFDYEFKQEGANTFLVTYGADRNKPMEWSRG